MEEEYDETYESQEHEESQNHHGDDHEQHEQRGDDGNGGYSMQLEEEEKGPRLKPETVSYFRDIELVLNRDEFETEEGV